MCYMLLSAAVDVRCCILVMDSCQKMLLLSRCAESTESTSLVQIDKATARDTMKNAGVLTVPGSDGLLQIDSTEEALRLAEGINYPVMIKATAGGGGRGMRLAKEPLDSNITLYK